MIAVHGLVNLVLDPLTRTWLGELLTGAKSTCKRQSINIETSKGGRRSGVDSHPVRNFDIDPVHSHSSRTFTASSKHPEGSRLRVER